MAKKRAVFIATPQGNAAVLLGFMGFEGRMVSSIDEFKQTYEQTVRDDSVGLLVIDYPLPQGMRDAILDHKLRRRMPFVFYKPTGSLEGPDHVHETITRALHDMTLE